MRSNQLSYLAKTCLCIAPTDCQMRCKDKGLFYTTQKIGLLFYSPIHAIHRRINRYISPIHKTDEVATKIYTQSIGCKGVTLNNAPPKLTIKICPARIMRVTHRNPLHEAKRSKADCTFPKAFALNIFQNCKNTNMEKKRVSSYRVSPPGTGAKLKK